ncbi:hypothetical protein EsDP_00005360 [Epichloe bromicola]|uniref:Cell wall galactomannoprotein n=1 Tax=Epichloe bromicola TaxID=79588 RepID=A0ABQ0CUV3_9HYPO
MKLVSASAVLCAISSIAHGSPLHARDAKPILDVLASVQKNIDGLDAAVKGWTCNPGPVLRASYGLVGTIKSGTKAVSGHDKLTLSESLGLLKPVQDLRAHAQALVDDLGARKPQIQADYECDVVRQTIADIAASSQALVDATVSKVPDNAKDIARKQAQGVTDVLNGAKAAFDQANCVNK